MKSALIFLSHILESIELIQNYTKSKTKNNFCSSPQLQDSVLRRIEIIGEAVKNIPDDFREKYPDVKWKKIAGMRDVIVHQYGIEKTNKKNN